VRPEHPPLGDPCQKCKLSARAHRKRPEHKASGAGKFCRHCGILRILHRGPRERSRSNPEYWKKYKTEHPNPKSREYIIGIDGEGKGRRKHRYVFLAAASDTGKRWSVSNYRGLTTRQCLDFFLSLPSNALVFGFAFKGYDLTKALADIPNYILYDLFNEDRRQIIRKGRIDYRPVTWKGYKLNYINGKLSVSKGTRQIAIWDIFRFFQSKFTSALELWKIGTEEEIKRMAEMKDKRSVFDKLPSWEIEKYCFDECEKLSALGRSLLKAHDDAGLPLKQFFGAGSTASALLKKIDINRYRSEAPESMRHAIACAFAGGRFEQSVSGPVYEPVDGWDISAAYPYQSTFLVCLKHGRWRRVTGDIDREIANAPMALVHWQLPFDRQLAWGPWPVRTVKGSIAFPSGAKGGWCWKSEYQWGKRLCPWARSDEAYIWIEKCDHRPFAEVPHYYLERLKLGKEGKGIVIKLGLNSGCYGKMAQSIGVKPPFQSWIWASNVTSGCRAQLLEGLVTVKDPWDVYMLATDGIQCRRDALTFGPPVDTGTFDSEKPLGGWEHKPVEQGVFYVRPGIYFPLNPTEKQIKEVRARGLGRKVLYDHWQEIVDAWEQRKSTVVIGHWQDKETKQRVEATEEREGIEWNGMTRFVGAVSALTRAPSTGIITRSKDYGEWVPNPIEVSFSPTPKRRFIMPNNRLETWPYLDMESEPYDPAVESPEAKLLKIAERIAQEQPDSDYSEDYLEDAAA
jgi:hypothetical protein